MKRVLYAALLLLAQVSQARADVDLEFQPLSSSTAVGQTFDVQIWVVADGTAITVDGFFTFDVTKLTVQSVTPGTAFGRPLLMRYDNALGTVDCAAGTAFGSSPPTGTVSLCTVRFGAVAVASPTILHWSTALPRKTGAYGSGGVSVLGTVTDSSVFIAAAANTPTTTPTSAPVATPTPAPAPVCCGDCNTDGMVTNIEYNLCRDILLGMLDISACPACSCTGSGQVLASDITQVSINAASGCPQATPVSGSPWAINPRDRGAVVFNSLDCRGTAGKPCLRIPILSGTPTSQQAGDYWCEDTGAIHRCCYATSPTTAYCMTGS